MLLPRFRASDPSSHRDTCVALHYRYSEALRVRNPLPCAAGVKLETQQPAASVGASPSNAAFNASSPPSVKSISSPAAITLPPCTAEDTQEQLLTMLASWWQDGVPDPNLESAAVLATSQLLKTVQEAVNRKQCGVRALQTAVCTQLQPIIGLARLRHSIAYLALQILCYRNSVTCQQICEGGIVEEVARSLSSIRSRELQGAMCYLLTGMVAFSEATHAAVISSGLVPQLVALCRCAPSGEAGESSLGTQLQQRAAAVLRNLAHNTRNHGLLINAGAVDALVDIMRDEQHPAARINAAVAVACLVGHEESNPRLQLDEQLVVHMLQVLGAACQGIMKHEAFWTVWKLCQGLASLAVNDSNKELIARNGGVQVLAEVLFGKHHNNEAAHRYALSTLWNLAFVESSRAAILAQPGLVDAIRTALNTTESARTKEVAKGCLWTLGLEQDVKGLTSSAGEVASQCAEGQEACLLEEALPHVMLSYEWGCQQSVMLIKTELQAAGYKTWMDIDKMSGSTLEAMARAVEDSAAVVVCVSKRYKESQACRTEAEYAFQQRKKIIPVLLERDYKPSGWLGALMGTRLYFPMHDPRTIPRRVPALMKELGEAGRLPSNSSKGAGAGGGPSSNGSSASSMTNSPGVKLTLDRPESWSHVEVEEWLRRVRCADYVGVFREKDMDGLALSGLHRMSSDHHFTHNTLVTEFGIHSLGQRLRLLEELHHLFS